MAGGPLKLCGLQPISSSNATELENINVTSGMRVISYVAVETIQHPRSSAVLYVVFFIVFLFRVRIIMPF